MRKSVPNLTPVPPKHPMLDSAVTISFRPINAGGKFFEPPPEHGILMDIDYNMRTLLIYRIIQDDGGMTHEQLVMHNLDDVFSIVKTMEERQEDAGRE